MGKQLCFESIYEKVDTYDFSYMNDKVLLMFYKYVRKIDCSQYCSLCCDKSHHSQEEIDKAEHATALVKSLLDKRGHVPKRYELKKLRQNRGKQKRNLGRRKKKH